MNPIVTERLILRGWRPEDKAPFAAINADPDVMRHLPALLDRAESDAVADRLQASLLADGRGAFAVEEKASGRFVGFVGLRAMPEAIPFAPATDIGWRIASDVWRQGYATEAARAVLAFAFDEIRLPEVLSITVPANAASRQVMEKIGLLRSAELDFDYPGMAEDDPLRHHLVYRLPRSDWLSFHV